ncbi:hypothetical protein ABPG75_013915 [Micractinium tetrahymenae]
MLPEAESSSQGKSAEEETKMEAGQHVPLEAPAERPDSKPSGVLYGVTDRPPWLLTAVLGLQTFLTMLGSTVMTPLLLVPAMGGTTQDTADVVCTCFFASGINTLLQTLLGARLPIVQGGSFAYISPVLAVAAQIQASQTFETGHDRFLYTMRTLQGGIIGSALIALGLALFNIFLWLLQHLSPITIGVNISILGLSLYSAGWPTVGTCVQLGIPVMALIILFAFHLRRVRIFGWPVFGLFPVLLGLGLTWLYAYIFTVAGVYDGTSPETQKACTTSQSNFDNIISEAPWIRVPYPGQWGSPIFTSAGVFTMFAAVIPAALESIGDYYAAARLGGAPQPHSEVVSRALAVESVCCVVSGLLGTTTGSTAYAENVGAISVTGVASRRVTMTGACFMLVFGLIGKFGALWASIPQAGTAWLLSSPPGRPLRVVYPLSAGLFVVMFSLIAGVGFSNLEGVDLRSERNIFILGFGLYCGLSVPDYFNSYTTTNGHGPVNTGSNSFNNVMNSIFETPAAVALMACLLLDMTIAAAPGERTREAWQQQSDDNARWWEDPEVEKIYGWPLGLTPKWRLLVDPYKAAAWSLLQRCLGKLRCRGCCAAGAKGGWRRRRKGSGGAATEGAVIEVASSGARADFDGELARALSSRATLERVTPVHTLSAM